MNVALIIERMDPSLGGRETYTAQVAKGLVGRDQRVTVICQSAQWTAPGVQIVQLGARGRMRHSRLANFVADVQQALKEESYAIVHAMLPVPGADIYHPHGGTIPGQFSASLRRRRLPGCLLARATRPFNLPRRVAGRLERQIAADDKTCCLCVSDMIARQFKDCYGRERNVRVIFNGVEVPDCTEAHRLEWRRKTRGQLGIGPEEMVFLTVATNFPLKGVRKTIANFARWRGQQSNGGGRLVIVGRKDTGRYRQVAVKRKVDDAVHFIGPTSEIFHYYAAADAVVLLSWYDPCSLVVLEAARWGIPSITTTFNGAAEMLAQGAGRIVESPRDRAGILAGMDEMSDPVRRAARSERCLAIADHLSLKRHLDELVQLYRQIAVR